MRGSSLVRYTAARIGLIALAASAAGGSEEPLTPARHAKVHPAVIEQATEGPVEFLVVMDQQADLARAETLPTKEERGRFVYDELRAIAETTQAPLLAKLAADGVEHRSLWIVNMVWVRGGAVALESIASREDVLRIAGNPLIGLTPPIGSSTEGAEAAGGVEWGIALTGADQVWAMGYTGRDVVIGGQDTGFDWDHPALKQSYRGWNGSSVDHDYNWHDSIHSGGGICGADSPEPCDDHGHGTHTMGTMAGDDGGSNRIGMAPGARWIACRNMNVGDGTPASYSECFQWFIAPTDGNDQNADPSKAPHVINNSWTCPPSEGCDFDTLQGIVDNTRAAGIVVVVSAGNGGSGCSSVADPPAIYASSFSVGATDSVDNIASFSARGPVTIDGSNRLKPEISAPGVNVRSSVPGGGYSFSSGTSMAGPHVAGLVALLLSALPDLVGRVDDIETLIESGALGLTSNQTCGNFQGSNVPNAVYGHGRIDAVQTILGDGDSDGTSNLEDCRPVDATVWAPPSGEVDLQVNQSNDTDLSWTSGDDGGVNPIYDLLRSENTDFAKTTCLMTNTSASATSDADLPPGGVFYYVVRIKNACGASNGTDGSGAVRSLPACFTVGG